ncbi:Abortive infection protein [Dietzia cinnamea P4]|nr:Abortive infection protein [Dietzia cinnamea P4]
MTVAETPTDTATATAITRRLRPRPQDFIRRHLLPTFFVLANLLSWIAWAPYVLSETALGVLPVTLNSIVGVLPGAYLGPIFSAFLVTAVTEGRAGVRSWIGRLLRWRVPGRWYAVALLGVPGGMLLTGFAFSGGEIHAPSLMALSMYVPLLLFQFVTTGLAEEPGWRDFALPRLQDRFSPLAASMILGPIWALWHVPLFFTEWGGYPDASWTRATSFLLFCLGFNLVMTWIFTSAAGSSQGPVVDARTCTGPYARTSTATMKPLSSSKGRRSQVDHRCSTRSPARSASRSNSSRVQPRSSPNPTTSLPGRPSVDSDAGASRAARLARTAPRSAGSTKARTLPADTARSKGPAAQPSSARSATSQVASGHCSRARSTR